MKQSTQLFSKVFPLVMLLLFSCMAGNGVSSQSSEPEPFQFDDGKELRSRMQQLAYELQILDWYLMNEEDEQINLQEEVLEGLQDIEVLASSLQQNEISASHQFLYDGMEEFLISVREARILAENGDARSTLVTGIVNACSNCHNENR